VPKSVLARAKELLGQLAVHHVGQQASRRRAADNQMDLFADPSRELLDQLRALNLDNISPRQALDLLAQWKDKLK
jgi:DNA mismatch repair protein MutS